MISVQNPFTGLAQSETLLLKLAQGLGIILVLLGLVVIIGWFTGTLALVQIHQSFVTMKFNTAFLFLICGIGLIAATRAAPRVMLSCAGTLVVLASLTSAQIVLGLDFGLDTLVIKDDVLVKTSAAGRMAPNTALAFLLSGACLGLIHFLPRRSSYPLLASVTGAVVASLGLLAVLGYAIDVDAAFGWGKYTAMALHTAVGFCLAGVALVTLVFINTRRSQFSTDKPMLAALATASLTVTLALSITLQNQQTRYQQKLVGSTVERASQTVQSELVFLIEALERFGGRWEAAGGLPEDAWQVDATQYVNTFPKLRAIEWVDSNYVIRRVIPYEGNEAILSLNLGADASRLQILERAKNINGPSMTKSIDLKQGGRGFLTYVPLWIDKRFDGFIVGVVDVEKLFEQSMDKILLDDEMWLHIHEDDALIFFSQGADHQHLGSPADAKRLIKIYGRSLYLSAGARPGSWLARLVELPFLMFIFGCVLTVLLITTVRGYFRSRGLLSTVESERERFHQVIEGSPGAILLSTQNGTIELINNKAEQLFGFSRSELLGKSIDMLVPFTMRGKHASLRSGYFGEPSARTMAAGRMLSALHKDGREIPVEIDLRLLHTETGPKALASISDLSEKTRQIEQLRTASNTLDRAGRMAKVGGWEIDLKNDDISWSDQTCRIHGVEPGFKPTFEQAIGFYPPDAASQINKAIENALENARKDGADWHMDLPLIRADGEHIWVRIQGEVELENGEPRRLLGAIQDITERTVFLKELERRNHELDSFAHVASHDLKSPLRGIDQLCSWLEEDLRGTLDKDSEKHLSLIRSRICRMENLLSDLLAYARAGRKEGTPEEVEAAQLVRDTFELCGGEGKFALFLEGDFPTFLTTRTPLELIIRNLMSNAMKHHDRDIGEIVVSVRHLGSVYEFEVRDDGPGIPEEYRERAFGMFQTLQSRDEVEGSGMGLAIIKKTVEAFGGRVELLNNKPRGTTVRFTWPDKVE